MSASGVQPSAKSAVHLCQADGTRAALFSATALPLVVVITEIGTESGRMLPENAAALVGAGMVSVLVYPLTGFSLLRRAGTTAGPAADPAGTGPTADATPEATGG